MKDSQESGYSEVIKAVFMKLYTNLNDSYCYPNPAKEKVVFDKIPNGSSIEIYSLNGDLIKKIIVKDRNAIWYLKNKAGKEVGSGVYFYVIKYNNFCKTGKISITK